MWHGGTPATAISVWKTSPEQGGRRPQPKKTVPQQRVIATEDHATAEDELRDRRF
jgi:hypothetical protein